MIIKFLPCPQDQIFTRGVKKIALGIAYLLTHSTTVLAVWLLVSGFLGEISERFHFHNGCLLVPIFFGAALTMGGVELSAVPHSLTDFAQLMFGLVLGARYERAFFARHRLFIPFALLNSLFILVASAIAGAALAWAFDLPIATMIIATSPGGLAEMTITAQALHISVPLVVAFHLFRVVVVNMGTQHIFVTVSRLVSRLPTDANPHQAATAEFVDDRLNAAIPIDPLRTLDGAKFF